MFGSLSAVKMPASCWWLSLQPDWYDGFNADENVWVSAHCQGIKSVHGYLSKSDGVGDNFSGNRVSDNTLEVCHTNSGTSTHFIKPGVNHKITPKSNPVSIDVTTSIGIGATTDGKDISVFECKSGIVRRKLSGHLADVHCVKFFPSNVVLLSGGSDMCVKIWSIESGSCPVTFTGHKRGITCLEIVERGRNVISGSLDGTIHLWNCSKGVSVATLAPQTGAINDITLFKSLSVSCVPSEEELDGEVQTQDKLLACVTDCGDLLIHSLLDKSLQTNYKHTHELTACCTLSEFSVVAGSSEGEILTFDIRNTTHPISSYKRSNYAINVLYQDPVSKRVWCGQKDGESYTIDPISDDTTLSCNVTLSSADCEPVNCLVAKSNYVFTASKDRVIRGYQV